MRTQELAARQNLTHLQLDLCQEIPEHFIHPCTIHKQRVARLLQVLTVIFKSFLISFDVYADQQIHGAHYNDCLIIAVELRGMKTTFDNLVEISIVFGPSIASKEQTVEAAVVVEPIFQDVLVPQHGKHVNPESIRSLADSEVFLQQYQGLKFKKFCLIYSFFHFFPQNILKNLKFLEYFVLFLLLPLVLLPLVFPFLFLLPLLLPQ